MKKVEMRGQRFFRLFVIKESLLPRKGGKIWWLCRCDCGVEKEFCGCALRQRRVKSCGCYARERASKFYSEMCGVSHPSWKGGRHKDKGYVRILRPEFPGCENYSRYVLEHIVVMSRHLGRPLYPGETIHHKNGVRDDNRIENLELRASQHGPGQRVGDLLLWAEEVVARYAQKTVSPCCV